jgi:hemerythrin
VQILKIQTELMQSKRGIGELTMDEKIEELSNEICMGAIDYTTQRDIKPHRNGVHGHIAERLIEKGYQKESDTAREILDEAKKWVKAHYKDKVTDSFGERPMLFMEAFGCLFEYLKEKYIDE